MGRRALPLIPGAGHASPVVRDNSAVFGLTAPGLFDAELPIAGMAGDQQAALFGRPAPAWNGEIHLRDRLLHARQYGQRTGRVAAPAPDDTCLSSRGQTTYAPKDRSSWRAAVNGPRRPWVIADARSENMARR